MTPLPRLTGLQAFSLALLALLDQARAELTLREYEVLLDMLAALIANDYVRRELDDENRQAA